MTRHKNAEVIHAWVEGVDIQIKDMDGNWIDIFDGPIFTSREYRIKPKEPEWWENIPEHGVLVISNYDSSIAVIVPEDIKDINTDPLEWTPLTNDQIERFKR